MGKSKSRTNGASKAQAFRDRSRPTTLLSLEAPSTTEIPQKQEAFRPLRSERFEDRSRRRISRCSRPRVCVRIAADAVHQINYVVALQTERKQCQESCVQIGEYR
jgi:hypothetical protein